ncbi:hypothetical protein CEQ90_09755 [Lewinellaceae bacterium SD302]|nr:hypothetical protein CEQ90_09755 [Lewinellaceae bacterium SD302]
MRYSYTKEELRAAVETSYSIAEVCRKLQIKAAGGNYTTLKQKFVTWNIDTSHFRGQGWNVGLKFKPNPRKPLHEILVKNSTFQAYKLKRRLLNENVLVRVCNSCNRTEWLDQPIPIELHHKNGDKHDNRLDNLELLCPNCHALTDNYRGRNIRVAH